MIEVESLVWDLKAFFSKWSVYIFCPSRNVELEALTDVAFKSVILVGSKR